MAIGNLKRGEAQTDYWSKKRLHSGEQGSVTLVGNELGHTPPHPLPEANVLSCNMISCNVMKETSLESGDLCFFLHRGTFDFGLCF